MKKFLRLLLSILSFSLLFFSCSNNLESNSLVISFNLQNQKNQNTQNTQRAATHSENLYVTVIMYDVENMEDQIENIPDFKIIQKQTVPVKNNSARITFNDITVGTKSIIKAQITSENKILYVGQSQIFVVSEGKNSITINLRPYSGVTDIPPENTQDPKDLSYDADAGILKIYTEEGLKTFRDIVNNSITAPISVDDAVFSPDDPNNQSLNAKLCSDIELSTETEWVPIGYYKEDDNKAYNGIFDGNGKCVKGLKITTNYSTDLGFFGCVQDATIMNLYVQGNITCDSSYNIGGIVGYAKSSDDKNVTISNCINNVEITNNYSSNSVGGILGCSSGAVDINSCVNIEEITNGYSVAGILGYGSSIVTIQNCLNLGKITMLRNSLDAVAGIANISGDREKLSSVTSCINASSIQGEDEDDNIYPIAYISSSPNATLSKNYYDSNILPTVNDVENVDGKTSSDLDTLNFQGWYNNTEPDSKYPIPSTIKNTFYNSFCWGTLSNEVLIPENTTPDIPSQYVHDAYYVKGDGDDNNDGLSRTTPKKNLTNVIKSLKGQNVRTIYIDGTLTAASQGVTESSKKNLVTITDTNFGESNKITLIGINDATIDAQSRGIFIETNLNFYMKMQNLTIKNGWNNLSSGAALWFYGSSLELDGCVIKDCVSTYDPQKYTGIYMSGSSSVLKMTNTTCENSIYLSTTEATIGSNCTIGTNKTEVIDGFITLDVSTLILDGENIIINKPIYVKNRNSFIQIGDYYSPGQQITIKLASGITDTYSNSNPYTLIPNCDGTKSTYFTIKCEDSSKTATLDTNGKITVSNKSE